VVGRDRRTNHQGQLLVAIPHPSVPRCARDEVLLGTCPDPVFGISSVTQSRAAHTWARSHLE
jgi:hypothetical protein